MTGLTTGPAAEPTAARVHAPLDPRLVAALDAARGLAAVYVLVYHVAKAHDAVDGASGLLIRFGQEAVIVFFLLSGFVIFANERDRALRPAGYYWRRVRRIYPPLIVALVVSTLVAFDNGDLAARFDVASLGGTLLALQDIAALKPGVIVDPYLGNEPLWTLSYEVGFYLAFPWVLRWWIRAPRRVEHGVGLVACACYALYLWMPNHAALVGAYFLIWWSGAMAARACREGGGRIAAVGPCWAWLLALAGVMAAGVVVAGYRSPGYFPFLQLRHVMAAMVLLALCFTPPARAAAAFAWRWRRPFGAVASISYALYILHFPLLIQWHRVQGGGWPFAAAGVLVILIAVAVERHLMPLIPRR